MTFLKKIPGFRSGVLWKRIVAIIGYICILLILFLNSTTTAGDYWVSFIEKLVVISVPYVLVFDVGGLRRKLPIGKSKNARASFLGAVLFSILWLIPAGVFYCVAENCWRSPAYKASIAEYNKERAAQKADELRRRQEAASSAAEAKMRASSAVASKGSSSSSSSHVSSSKSTQVSSTAPAAPASSSASPVVSNSIKGSSATDIKLSLEKWGLKAKASGGPNGKGYLYNSTATDPDTGAMLTYSITAEDDFSIDSASFSVVNSASSSGSAFVNFCDSFLGYCATMPYDSADQQKAKNWITTNMGAANKAGSDISVTIGDAKFSLSGNGNMSRLLEVEKAK